MKNLDFSIITYTVQSPKINHLNKNIINNSYFDKPTVNHAIVSHIALVALFQFHIDNIYLILEGNNISIKLETPLIPFSLCKVGE